MDNTLMKMVDVSYTIHDKKILDHVNLDIKKGEVTAILGPSGAGKSTLLRTINALTKPDEGKLNFDGREIQLNHITRVEKSFLRKNTGMVFQNYILFTNKTVEENITEGLRLVHGYKKDEAKEITYNCLKQVHMEDYANAFPQQLSGGQKQRVSIARILAIKPALILMDEPTSALDHDLVQNMQDSINELSEKGNTLIVVTHDLAFAQNIASEVYLIEKGKIINHGKAKDIFDYSQL